MIAFASPDSARNGAELARWLAQRPPVDTEADPFIELIFTLPHADLWSEALLRQLVDLPFPGGGVDATPEAEGFIRTLLNYKKLARLLTRDNRYPESERTMGVRLEISLTQTLESLRAPQRALLRNTPPSPASKANHHRKASSTTSMTLTVPAGAASPPESQHMLTSSTRSGVIWLAFSPARVFL